MMREVKSCGFLIVRGSPVDSFLLMKHRTRWDLPKGHVDPGETELECALRELWEETAISRHDIRIDDTFRFTTHYTVRKDKYDGKAVRKTLVVFLGHLKHDVDIRITEHIGYEWYDWQPPHEIQAWTIDPLLAHLEQHPV